MPTAPWNLRVALIASGSSCEPTNIVPCRECTASHPCAHGTAISASTVFRATIRIRRVCCWLCARVLGHTHVYPFFHPSHNVSHQIHRYVCTWVARLSSRWVCHWVCGRVHTCRLLVVFQTFQVLQRTHEAPPLGSRRSPIAWLASPCSQLHALQVMPNMGVNRLLRQAAALPTATWVNRHLRRVRRLRLPAHGKAVQHAMYVSKHGAVHTHVCLSVSLSLCLFVCRPHGVYTRAHAPLCTCVYCIYICMYAHTYVCMYTRIMFVCKACVCMHVCIFAWSHEWHTPNVRCDRCSDGRVLCTCLVVNVFRWRCMGLQGLGDRLRVVICEGRISAVRSCLFLPLPRRAGCARKARSAKRHFRRVRRLRLPAHGKAVQHAPNTYVCMYRNTVPCTCMFVCLSVCLCVCLFVVRMVCTHVHTHSCVRV